MLIVFIKNPEIVRQIEYWLLAKKNISGLEIKKDYNFHRGKK